ncbi:helix-turn-helix transcriptional regulator [Paraburkholderia sp.]|uniref:AraC family transcriptional regulator n=1 Tax=Paraburkholderia sp. TaxID=1926495 RepID=UPI00286ED964|nr:helix-turn-helix transcriptional regulator [Paraburkholderia sp.]
MAAPRLQTFGQSAAAKKVIAQAINYADGAHEIAHIHHRAQLIYVAGGIVRVITPGGLWTLKPGMALLIGTQIEHELHMVGQTALRTLYIDPDTLPPLAGDCRMIALDDLLRASIAAMCEAGDGEAAERRTAVIVPLILHLLAERLASAADADASDIADEPRLPLPDDLRLRTICESLIADAANADTLEQWAERTGASVRTLARLFRQQTGMSFVQWRERLRLEDALSKLSVGHAPGDVAQALGYADVRTFTVMFRRAFGSTPQQFRQSLNRG